MISLWISFAVQFNERITPIFQANRCYIPSFSFPLLCISDYVVRLTLIYVLGIPLVRVNTENIHFDCSLELFGPSRKKLFR